MGWEDWSHAQNATRMAKVSFRGAYSVDLRRKGFWRIPVFFFIVVTNRRVFLLCDSIGSKCLVFILRDFIGSNSAWNYVESPFQIQCVPRCNFDASKTLPATSLSVSANRLKVFKPCLDRPKSIFRVVLHFHTMEEGKEMPNVWKAMSRMRENEPLCQVLY